MSEYTNWLEQHQDNCDICHSLLIADDVPNSKDLLKEHLEEATNKADALAQMAYDEQRGC